MAGFETDLTQCAVLCHLEVLPSLLRTLQTTVELDSRVEWKTFLGVFKSFLTVPKHCIRNLSSILRCKDPRKKLFKFWKYYRESNNKISIFLKFKGQRNAPGWEDSKSGLKNELGPYLTPFLAKKRSKSGELCYFASFRQFFCLKRDQMLSDFYFETRFGILSSWRIFLTLKI